MWRGNIKHNVFVNYPKKKKTRTLTNLLFRLPVSRFNTACHSFPPTFFSLTYFTPTFISGSREKARAKITQQVHARVTRELTRWGKHGWRQKLAGFTVFLSIFFLPAGRGYTGRKERENEGSGEGTKLDVDKGVEERETMDLPTLGWVCEGTGKETKKERQ